MQLRKGRCRMDRNGNPYQPQLLENIEEEMPMSPIPWDSSPFHPPETPQEPMEFLSRSWSLSAFDLNKALADTNINNDSHNNSPGTSSNFGHQEATRMLAQSKSAENNQHNPSSCAPFKFATHNTAQLVMDQILCQSEASQQASRKSMRGSPPMPLRSTGSRHGSSPVSAKEYEDFKAWCLRQHNANSNIRKGESAPNLGGFKNVNSAKPQMRGKTVGRWLKDIKEKKKEDNRVHNAQVHAAVSVAGVASAVAAIAAATATNSRNTDDNQQKMSMAMASAAALVASQCVEAAESLGADREQISSVVSSAVSVRKPGDVMTLTAGAATALRGAATLKARVRKEPWNHAAVIPFEKGPNLGSQAHSGFSQEFTNEDSDSEMCSLDFLARGGELLKRTSQGTVHPKHVSVYIDKNAHVIVKLKSTRIGGSLTKKKKGIVYDVCKDTAPSSGRHFLDGEEKKHYFGLQTDHGLLEFECRSQKEQQTWTEGIRHLLTVARSQKKR